MCNAPEIMLEYVVILGWDIDTRDCACACGDRELFASCTRDKMRIALARVAMDMGIGQVYTGILAASADQMAHNVRLVASHLFKQEFYNKKKNRLCTWYKNKLIK